jgi:DNA-binding protein YbaB
MIMHKFLLLCVVLSFLLGCQSFLQTTSPSVINLKRLTSKTRRNLFGKPPASGSNQPGSGGLGDLMKKVMGGQGNAPNPYAGAGGMTGMGGGMPGMGGGMGGFDMAGAMQQMQKMADDYKIQMTKLGNSQVSGMDSTGGVVATFSGIGVPLYVKIDEATSKKSAEQISNAVTEAIRNGHQIAASGIENSLSPEMKRMVADTMQGTPGMPGPPPPGPNGMRLPF